MIFELSLVLFICSYKVILRQCFTLCLSFCLVQCINHNLSLFSLIKRHVILSVPIPSSVLGAKILESNYATASEFLVSPVALSIFFYISSQACSFVKQSQIPSHAKIMN